MHKEDFKRICEAALGKGWQTKLAKLLDINPRTVRRWSSGDCLLPHWVKERVVRMDSRLSDEWIVGDGTKDCKEYLVHTVYPMFICKVACTEEEIEKASIKGITYDGNSGFFHSFDWIDRPPLTEEDLIKLLQEADNAILSLPIDYIKNAKNLFLCYHIFVFIASHYPPFLVI